MYSKLYYILFRYYCNYFNKKGKGEVGAIFQTVAVIIASQFIHLLLIISLIEKIFKTGKILENALPTNKGGFFAYFIIPFIIICTFEIIYFVKRHDKILEKNKDKNTNIILSMILAVVIYIILPVIFMINI